MGVRTVLLPLRRSEGAVREIVGLDNRNIVRRQCSRGEP